MNELPGSDYGWITHMSNCPDQVSLRVDYDYMDGVTLSACFVCSYKPIDLLACELLHLPCGFNGNCF